MVVLTEKSFPNEPFKAFLSVVIPKPGQIIVPHLIHHDPNDQPGRVFKSICHSRTSAFPGIHLSFKL
jgi:hypothetical protein